MMMMMMMMMMIMKKQKKILVDHVWSMGGGCGELNSALLSLLLLLSMISNASMILFYCYHLTIDLWTSHDIHMTSTLPCCLFFLMNYSEWRKLCIG